MTVHLWIDPAFGASGDMLLGAFAGYLDQTGGSTDALGALDALGLEPFELRSEATMRCGLSCHRMHVETSASAMARHWTEIDRLIADAELPARAQTGARRTFRLLGEIEAAQHGVDLDDVHFHEVGAVDSIIDILGAWLLLDTIDPQHVVVGPVGLGHGTVTAAHGQLPLPAPATLALLQGAPIRGLDLEAETCTPTGAALLVTMADAWGPLPSGAIRATARGAGGRNPETHPNAVTVVAVAMPENAAEAATAGTTTAGTARTATGDGTSSRSWSDEPALIIECNVDDASPELLAATIHHLLDAGADDAWLVPIGMKKGRAATLVRVLTDHEHHDDLVERLLTETGSLGCRTVDATKHVLPREFTTVELRGHAITMKVGPTTAKPEHDELAALAASTGLPLRQLDLEARLAWQQRTDQT
jgi:uncharacterized protein (TIGR00299 family) protein